MRLPDGGHAHLQRIEAARQLHEQLWAAHKAGTEPVVIPVESGDTKLALMKLSGNLHRFWSNRHYRLMLRQSPARDAILAWLVARRWPQS